MNPNRVSAQYKDKSRYPSNVFKRPFMTKPSIGWKPYDNVFQKIDTQDKEKATRIANVARLPQKPSRLPVTKDRRAYY